MSIAQKLLSAAFITALLFSAGSFTTQAQSNLDSINIDTADTAELQVVLSNLQQRVNNLFQQVVGNAQSENSDRPSSEQESDQTNNQVSDAGSQSESIDIQTEQFELSDSLNVGSTGQEVRWVQRLLVQEFSNQYSDNLITGFYGDTTASAVSQIQRQAGLDETGQVDEQTLDYLQNSSSVDDSDADQTDEEVANDNGSSGGEQEGAELTDEYLDTYTFTATLTQINETTWRYDVTGSVPNPGHKLDVTTDGVDIVAVVTPTEGPAISQVTEVNASGQIKVSGNQEAPNPTFEVRQRDVGNAGDEGGASERNARQEPLTLTDTFLDTYEFTATVTQEGTNEWGYEVKGSTPNPNYDLAVTTDGPAITAQIRQNPGAAPTVVSDVEASGSFSTDSITEKKEISFDVRKAGASSEDKSASDSGSTEQAEQLNTQQGVQVYY